MEQELTITKSIINFFYHQQSTSNFEISEQQQCYQLLKQNYFIADKDKKLFNELQSEINNISDEQKREAIKTHLGKLLVDRIRLSNFTLDNSNYKYFKLCNASEDKIYFDPEIEDQTIDKLRLELFNIGINEVEIYGVNSFLNPSENCRFKNPNSKLVYVKKFEKYNKYNLCEVLIPFLRDSKEIKFIDKYLANHLSKFHLEKLLRSISGNPKLFFITLTEQDYSNDKRDKAKAGSDYLKLKELATEYNVSLENIFQSGHFDRYIITDKFEISLPGGFDQFNKDGVPFIKDENKILKMYVERK